MEPSRTFVGTVVCVDLVGYSKRSVAQQSEIKQVFNSLLMEVLEPVPADDRIILDTGDGAAISYLGDPEESLALGVKLRDTMNGAAGRLGVVDADAGPVRIGINLGPVRLAVDMTGPPKIIGDGINVAEKICEFARPGQVVVSHSFHDMVTRMSERHRPMFHCEGVRTDRNMRDHDIYSVVPAGTEIPPEPAPESDSAAAPARRAGTGLAFLRSRKVGLAAAVLIAIIGSGVWIAASRTRDAAPASTVEIAKAPEPPPLVEGARKPWPSTAEQAAPPIATAPH